MAQAIRQSNLFVAEDWRVIYKTFQEVSFRSYDFDSIRTAMVEYIRINYPEDFNDWIESSEFVAIVDLIAYLGQSLAFRMDLNTRENFLDTAESRDSVLRLARMLSYVPKRNYPSFGLVKVIGVQTDEPIIDSENRNLSGIQIDWNSSTNLDWLEQFTLILNSAFNSTNQFGEPVKSGTVANIPTDLYEFNNIRGVNVVHPFSVSTSGRTMDMEIVRPTFEDLGVIDEASPNPYAAFSILYRNDGQGNGSPNTGFFLPFKQGSLAYQDVELTVPVENRVLNIDVNNINQTDVWFQEIDEFGQITSNWTKVPTVVSSSNIIYNSIERQVRDIYSVITRESDQISLRFADGQFGNIPQGVYRVWYRTSNGLRYTINPEDIQNFSFTIPYQNLSGQTYNLTITYSLQTSVSNSVERESLASIKQNAPRLYYTQDRMINGEDYNIFPLVKSTQVQKIKAVNRTYSGHSRYVDINDPTGTFQNTDVFADDGIFYREEDTDIQELSTKTSLTFRGIISSYIEPAIQDIELRNFVIANGDNVTNFDLSGANRAFWRTSTQISGGSTGYFEIGGIAQVIGTGTSDPWHYITEDALVNLVLSTDTDSNGIWVRISNLDADGAGTNPDSTGKVTIDERIDDNVYIIKKVVPSFSTSFTDTEKTNIESQLQLKNTFGLGFDFVTKDWYIIEPQDVDSSTSTYSLQFARDKSGANLDASWLVRVEYTSSAWRFYVRGLRYVWESTEDVRFFFSNDFRAISIDTGLPVQDQINVLKVNSKPTSNEPLEDTLKLSLVGNYQYVDGYIEPRRVKVSFFDTDQDGTPDDPEIFDKVVGSGEYIFWKRITGVDGYEYLVPSTVQYQQTTVPTSTNPATPVDGDLTFVYDLSDKTIGSFYEYDADDDIWNDVTSSYEFNAFGRKDLYFNWKHFASRQDRIDPAITNIIDIFVLTTNYDTELRNWIKVNGRPENKPEEPTSDELQSTFTDLLDYKSISDEIIWRPTKYKILFGEQASEELKAKFNVVKVDGVSITDNEIKSQVINYINEFFDINNWNFGDTFYFTELAAFLHQRMATILASVVLVPLSSESAFGNLFQVKAEPDEIFISAAKVSDINIVSNLTPNTLRIGN